MGDEEYAAEQEYEEEASVPLAELEQRQEHSNKSKMKPLRRRQRHTQEWQTWRQITYTQEAGSRSWQYDAAQSDTNSGQLPEQHGY